MEKPSAPKPPIFPPPRLVAAARVLAGLSQRELGLEADVARSIIGRYEAGHRGLHARTLEAIVTVLRDYGVRFVNGSDDVVVGLLLTKGKGADRLLAVAPPPRAARRKRNPEAEPPA